MLKNYFELKLYDTKILNKKIGKMFQHQVQKIINIFKKVINFKIKMVADFKKNYCIKK